MMTGSWGELVKHVQRFCDERSNARALEIAECLKRSGAQLLEEPAGDYLPVVGYRYNVQDTERTVTSPDGHFLTEYLTVSPVREGNSLYWHASTGRPRF